MIISVVIPTYNRRRLLARTLPGLFAQQFSASQYEIVIVVDGSTDGTAEWLRTLSPPCALRIIEQPNRGLISARNTGLKAACGELVLLLDDDIECPPGLLAEHVAAHSADPVVAFGDNAVSPASPKNLLTDWARQTSEQWLADLQRRGAARWPGDAELGANYSARRELLLKLGGWDPRFRTRELEFGLRLWKSGVPFRFLPHATAYHIYDKSDDMVRIDAEPYGREEVLLCRLHPEYRPVSALASMEQGGAATRRVRSWLARTPFSPDHALRPCFRMISAFSRPSRIRRLGIRVLQLRHSTTMLRGALRELGSAHAYDQEFSRRVPALAYHHVGPKRPGTNPGLTVSPAQFERQIRGFKRRGCNPISAEQWHAWIRQGTPLPPRPVLISFDDAYADLAEYAFPVLQHYGFVALVFAATATIGRTNEWDERSGWGTHRVLSAQQVQHWANHGILFGSHSRTHPDLTTLGDEELEAEIAGSKQELAAILGGPPRAFAYPYGYHDARVRAAVARHYDTAFTIEPGWNTLATEATQLRRFVVNPSDGWLGLATRVWLGPLQQVRDFLALRTRIRTMRGHGVTA